MFGTSQLLQHCVCQRHRCLLPQKRDRIYLNNDRFLFNCQAQCLPIILQGLTHSSGSFSFSRLAWKLSFQECIYFYCFPILLPPHTSRCPTKRFTLSTGRSINDSTGVDRHECWRLSTLPQAETLSNWYSANPTPSASTLISSKWPFGSFGSCFLFCALNYF